MADLDTDCIRCQCYKVEIMTTENATSSTQMTQWVLDLIAATNLTGPAAAEILTQAIGAGYNRFTLYKMTKGRKVTMQEAQALSKATGFPLSPEDATVLSYDQRRANLSPRRQAIIDAILDDLEAAESKDREGDQ